MAPAKRINLLFGGLVALLGGFPLVYSLVYLERAPVIQSPATTSLPPGHPNLPENHPPLDYARELAALEERSRAEPQNPDYRPHIAQALFNKGIVLHSGRNDLKGAIAAWEELLRTNPNLPQRADIEQRIEQLKASQR